ncbi:hypothetical protein M0657_004083 [Pyricularia oryzae]|uniref:Uncharacterized protein n=1 Tax=Pyricularia oryzae (strain Y34) TaxID=1143189 RepID=A0AA97NVY0_PYRO3|nr:hypothetical protein OOU_Y34scaffold00608g72 [Pyricularia oryzae Y34]KAI7911788.1 hypothetical protein M9X92_010358 [Pyricularia oryzae]KAI7925768.1 hypothetical protein M0657_004083 [Pyricularia oryzae]
MQLGASGRLNLESMPCEILRMIVGCFSLSPYEAGEPVLSPEFLENRRELRRLCLVSRKLWHAAVPFLYEVVITHGPGQEKSDRKLPPLLLLLRSLLANPGLRPRIRHMACLVSLKGAKVTSQELDAVRRLWNSECLGIRIRTRADVRVLELADLPVRIRKIRKGREEDEDNTPMLTGDEAEDEYETSYLAETTRMPDRAELDGLGERIFAAILCLASKLDSVAFQMPRCATVPTKVDEIKCTVTSGIIDRAMRDEVVGSNVLQNLTTVKVQPDMRMFMYYGWDDETGDDEEPCRGVRLDACPGLFNAPNITTVEGFKDSGGWDRLPTQTKNVKVAGILEPDTVSTICDYPNLERLTIRPAALDMAKADIEDDEFNSALLKRADTLKQLDFRTMGNETLTTSYGPEKRLHCLPKMHKLEDLTIELFALFGTSDKLRTQGPLADLLPQEDGVISSSSSSSSGSCHHANGAWQHSRPKSGSSLRRLQILEQWTYGDPVCPLRGGDASVLSAYREALRGVLLDFAKDCGAQRLPRLEKFRFVRHEMAALSDGKSAEAIGQREMEEKTRADFEHLKQLFAEEGVCMEVAV